jgi:LmbE family N-acetylglucosaminyl deacetylase
MSCSAEEFTYFDIEERASSPDISLLFPGWVPGDERLVILAPHDDDAALGAGYALQAAQVNGGEVYVLILCDGSAGYSRPDQRDTIVATRRAEALAAYRALGLDEQHVRHCGYPDFSLAAYLGWKLPGGVAGAMQQVLPALRELRPTRLLASNGYMEHTDHEATARIACFDGPQIGDPVLADYGSAEPVRSMLQYAVWGDLSPEDALVHGRSVSLRGNRAILAPDAAEEQVMRAVTCFGSQAQIIQDLVAHRASRRHAPGWLEVYLTLEPRAALDYDPYHAAVRQIEQRRGGEQ